MNPSHQEEQEEEEEEKTLLGMIKQRAKQELPGRLVSVEVMSFLLIAQESCLERWLEILTFENIVLRKLRRQQEPVLIRRINAGNAWNEVINK